MRSVLQLLAVALTLSCIPCIHAHSLHQSTAEAQWNEESKKLEVSLTVFISDLELALMRQSERLMSADKTPAAEFDGQILTYLAKTFVVSDEAGKAAKIEWVGRELDRESVKSGDPMVTLFFQIALPARAPVVVLKHGVLSDLFQDQMNLLHFRGRHQSKQLRFTRESVIQKLQLHE